MASFSRGSMRSTSPVLVLTTMLLPSASSTSIDSTLRISHGRATKLYGLLVSAPTGHRSITLPDSSERKNFST
uniref:Putative secreted peptide n=1 Tax=Anopheles braziliensis TaxID=58242 RepID=A0A2M3ZNY4_9DIPT